MGVDAELALPTLWGTAARVFTLLGLPSVHDRLRHVP